MGVLGMKRQVSGCLIDAGSFLSSFLLSWLGLPAGCASIWGILLLHGDAA
jgi:hypothetical protein